MKNFKFSIIGAGAGGTLLAIQLKIMGLSVKLMDNNKEIIDKMNELDTLKATGKTEAEAKPDLITTDIGQCIGDTDVIMVCTTTDAHPDVATAAAPFLKDGQIVVLNPGHLGGVLVFRNALKMSGCNANIMVAEASDLMYACRTMEIGHTFHSGIKERIKLASVPAKDAEFICDELKDIFPCFIPAKNILETGLGGSGGLLHSIPCVMNINKVELKQEFDYYIEGLTPGVCNIIEKADKERIAVSDALNVSVEPVLDHLKKVYKLEPNNLYDAIQSCKPYYGIKSPANTNHRFFQEDTLCDLVPIASLGKLLEIPTPTIDAIILLESILLGKDFIAEGRNIEALGLAGKTAKDILEMVE